MNLLKYKDFTWPNNPQVYRETITREPRYVTVEGVPTYNGISGTHRIITGSGVFFGVQALEHIEELMKLAESAAPGELFHPLWGSRYCYLTKLEVTQEPTEKYVAYSFEFMEATKDGVVPA